MLQEANSFWLNKLVVGPVGMVVGALAGFASASYSSIRKRSDLRVLRVVGVAMWAMCDGPLGLISTAACRIVSASKKAKMRRIHTAWVEAQMVNRDFIGRPFGTSLRNVINEELVSQPVGLELPFVVGAESLNDNPVSEAVTRANPVPAIGLFVELNAARKAIQQWFWWASSSHARMASQ